MKIAFNKFLAFFILIFILTLFLRLYSLTTIPKGFHQDEAANTYVGRFTILNHVDPYGNPFPLFYFNKLGDYPPVIPMYVSAIGTFFFGPTIFGARIAVALLSTLTIIPIYLISSWIFKKRKIALFTIFLFAICPWDIVFARSGTEGTVAMFSYMYGLMCLIYAFKNNNIKSLISAGILLLLTYFIYPAFRIIVPLTFLATPILFLPKIISFQKIKQLFTQKYFLIFIILTLLSLTLTFFIANTDWGKGRFNQTSIFNSTNSLEYTQFINDGNNITIERIFHNKVEFYTREFIKQYFSYFNPNFLFTQGGLPQWFSIPNTGLFYISYALLIIPMLLTLFSKTLDTPINKRLLFFLFIILLTIPIPAALTSDNVPQTHRTLLMSVIFLYIFSYGYYLLDRPKKIFTIIKSILLFLIFIEFLFFIHNYFQHENSWTAINRRDGNVEAVSYINQNRTKYNNVYVFAGNWFPAYYLYFTNNFDKKLVGQIGINFHLDHLDNVKFNEADCPPQNALDAILNEGTKYPSLNNLIVMRSACSIVQADKQFNSSYKQIKTIETINNLEVFFIYTNSTTK
jgi:4-amino-4-deoxy-L-arabinose transferase-like glycosyltransferase